MSKNNNYQNLELELEEDKNQNNKVNNPKAGVIYMILSGMFWASNFLIAKTLY